MKKRLMITVLSVLTAAVFCSTGFSQEAAPLIQSVSISVSAQKMKGDERGTDVSNIYTISVGYGDKKVSAQTFNVLYYLDGVYIEEFKGQTLPFAFTRNFKGQLDSAHEIRIDLEDQDLRIVGRKSVTINVDHAKAR